MEYPLASREEKRQFYKNALKTTLPIAFQNFMDACVNSADVIMLMLVGVTEQAASSLAGQVAFVLNMLLFGLSSGASVLAAQYWGIRDNRSIERVMALALKISVTIGLIVTLCTFLVPGGIMRIFTDDAGMIVAGTEYLRAISPSYVLSSFVVVYLAVMRSVERVKMSAIVHSSAVVLNVILNACFIFGIWVFPKLGIKGVALATTITRVIEAGVCVADTLLTKGVRVRIKDFFEKNRKLFSDFMKFSLPAAANDMVWGLAFSVYSVILGHLSENIVSANAVASVIRNLATVVCFGVSSAAAIMLGNTMGAGRLEEARVYGKRFVYLAVWTALAGGALILLTRPLVLSGVHWMVEDANPVVLKEVNLMLLINAYYVMGQSVNTMLICGIFRAGGDVKFGLVCDFLAMWAYAVPIGLFAAFVLKLPEMWVYFILCLDEFVKMPVIIRHYKKGQWARNITRTF